MILKMDDALCMMPVNITTQLFHWKSFLADLSYSCALLAWLERLTRVQNVSGSILGTCLLYKAGCFLYISCMLLHIYQTR